MRRLLRRWADAAVRAELDRLRVRIRAAQRALVVQRDAITTLQYIAGKRAVRIGELEKRIAELKKEQNQ